MNSFLQGGGGGEPGYEDLRRRGRGGCRRIECANNFVKCICSVVFLKHTLSQVGSRRDEVGGNTTRMICDDDDTNETSYLLLRELKCFISYDWTVTVTFPQRWVLALCGFCVPWILRDVYRLCMILLSQLGKRPLPGYTPQGQDFNPFQKITALSVSFNFLSETF